MIPILGNNFSNVVFFVNLMYNYICNINIKICTLIGGALMAAEVKRILSDIPEAFFWEIKRKLAELQLKQKTVLAIALREFIGSTYPIEELVTDEDDLNKIKALGIK